MSCTSPSAVPWRQRRALLPALLFGLLAVAAALSVASPASAHAELEHTVPAAGAVLAEPPRQIVLDFSERVDLKLGGVTVTDPRQHQVHTGTVRQSGGRVVVPLPAGLGDGSYLVRYRVVSADSHPVSGGFTFSIGAPSTGVAGSPTASSASEDPLVRVLFGLTRWAGFVGLVLMIGPALTLIVLWPRRLDPRPVRRLVWSGWWLTFAATAAGLVMQVPYAAGTGLTAVRGAGLLDVATSRFGIASQIRMELLVAGAPLLYGVLRSRLGGAPRRPGQRTAAIGLVVVLLATLTTWPLAGHAGASRLPAVSVASDTLHLLSMAIWIGGLLVLGLLLLPRADARELGLLLPEWSRWAASAVVVIVGTGSLQTFTEVGGWSRFVTTPYGRLVLAKIGLLCVILLLAAAARALVRRRYVLPAGYASSPEIRSLRRGVLAEAFLGLVVLAVTAVLVQTAPAREATAGSASTAGSGPGGAAGAHHAIVRQNGGTAR